MKKLDSRTGMIVGTLLTLTLGAQGLTREQERPTVVVGTFDSRAITLAYVRSEAFDEYLGAQRKDIERAIERARDAGDGGVVAALEAVGPAMQERIHRRGFGTAPVDEFLARIADELPRIAEEAGVDVIVSKWSLTYRDPSAELVDVTDLLVAEFGPDEKTLQAIREICATEPVPLDQLEGDH